jgi:hypothetical protein
MQLCTRGTIEWTFKVERTNDWLHYQYMVRQKKIPGNRLLLDHYIQNSSCNNNTNVLNQLNSPLAIVIGPQDLVNFFGENS